MAVVVNFLRNAGMGHIGLWGRSMGAVTALRYCVAQQDYSIAGLVLDSPFRNLPLLIRELARDRGIPGFASSIAIHYIRRAIVAKAGFDIQDCDTEASAAGCHAPALFCHGLQVILIERAFACVHPEEKRD